MEMGDYFWVVVLKMETGEQQGSREETQICLELEVSTKLDNITYPTCFYWHYNLTPN